LAELGVAVSGGLRAPAVVALPWCPGSGAADVVCGVLEVLQGWLADGRWGCRVGGVTSGAVGEAWWMWVVRGCGVDAFGDGRASGAVWFDDVDVFEMG